MSPKDPLGSPGRTEDAPQHQYDDDDDDLSITSTNPGDIDSEREWEVDDVLAERRHPSIPDAFQYLIMWEGFKMEDCTWEPVENLGNGLLAKWEENKAEIDAGTREAFDLATFEAAFAERVQRHIRRNAKRQRLGLPLTLPLLPEYTDATPVESPVEESLFTSEDEAQEVGVVEAVNAASSEAKATSSTSTPSSTTAKPTSTSTSERIAKQNTTPGAPSRGLHKDPGTSRVPEKGQEQPPLPHPKTSTKAPPKPSSSLPAIPAPLRKSASGTMTGYQGTARKSSVFRHNTAKASASTPATATNKPLSAAEKPPVPSAIKANQLEAKRLTATRTRQVPVSSGVNIFAGGKQRKKRANLIDAMGDPSKAPKLFSKMRTMNTARKRGEEKGDVVGDLSTIPSKFIIGNEQANTISRKSSLISPTTTGPPHGGGAFNPPSAASATVSKPQVSLGHAQQAGAEDLPASKRKKSVRFTGEDNEQPVGTIDDLFGNPTDKSASPKASDAGTGAPASSRHISLATYQERGHTQTIQKVVKFGGSEKIPVKFSGITRHSSAWLTAFKADTSLHLSHTCASYHFFKQGHQLFEERLSAGIIEPGVPECTVALSNVANSLQRASIGMHLVTPEYSILVYSGDGWDWLDLDAKKSNPDYSLHYLIYRSPPVPQIKPSEVYRDPKAPNESISPNGMKDLDLGGVLTGLDFAKMLPQQASLKDKQAYMLVFPLKAKQLLCVVTAWLRKYGSEVKDKRTVQNITDYVIEGSCQPDRPIFTLEQPDSWALFHDAVSAGGGGTLILHADFVLWKLEKMPSLWRMLENSKYTFWHLSTGEDKRPQYPSGLDATSIPGTLQLTRLFPYGRAFLITPSFAISEPAKLCDFFKWFRQYAHNPGHIIVTCHDFPQFLRNITEEKQREYSAFKTLSPDSKETHAFLERNGRVRRDIDDHLRAWLLLHDIMDQFGDEGISEDVRRIHWLSEFIDASDEQSLVNAFCWWTQLKCDRFRRFYVLGSNPDQIHRAYRFIEIPRYFNTEGSDPDIAGMLAERKLSAQEHKEQTDKFGGGTINRLSKTDREPKVSVYETPFSFPGNLFHTDNVQELQRWIDGHRRSTVGNWSELHQMPVSWRDRDMALQFGDGDEHTRHFDTFGNWFKAAPKLSKRRNTWYGLFYTITDDWDEKMPKRKYERHPWLAVYRPKNPHLIGPNGEFATIELFIWDAAATERERFGHGLLDMQCQLIDYVYETVPAHYPGCTLSNVWYSSIHNLRLGPKDNYLDITCRKITEMFDNGREELPPMDNILRGKWTAIDPRLWSAGMSPMTTRLKPADEASEPIVRRIPQTEEDKLKPEKLIWHPVRRGIKGRGTKCFNDLHETCLKARLQDPQCNQIRYQYRPTPDWWKDQIAEGRNYGYVCVQSAGKIIERLPHNDHSPVVATFE
ncbi:hypothetical protein NUW58_g1969 [Xylaria curta]|uniref:Uncharacterized protein n=1 Tax=Xylaria curta TaxID=42375 RepID=A0ACC1PHU6_9PEZI|nr:hypothetical protein NUW58_g1969 [Xylaria curta]